MLLKEAKDSKDRLTTLEEGMHKMQESIFKGLQHIQDTSSDVWKL